MSNEQKENELPQRFRLPPNSKEEERNLLIYVMG